MGSMLPPVNEIIVLYVGYFRSPPTLESQKRQPINDGGFRISVWCEAITLTEVFSCRYDSKIAFNVKPTDQFPFNGDNVVNMPCFIATFKGVAPCALTVDDPPCPSI